MKGIGTKTFNKNIYMFYDIKQMSFWWDIESDFKPRHFKIWLLWEAHHQHNQAKTLTVRANSPFDHLIEVNKSTTNQY